MKSIIHLILVLLLVNATASAQSDSMSSANNEEGTVVFYRPYHESGASLKMKITANEEPIIGLANWSYYTFQTKAGEYSFVCSMRHDSELKLTVEPGKTYYVRCAVGYNWSGKPIMELVDPAIATAEIRNWELRKQAYKPMSLAGPKSRFGAVAGGGFGFETIALFIDEDNKDVTLSTGGGFSIGAKYGYEVSKYFDVSCDFFYQRSTLSSRLENADASFDRVVITLTPALIIPIMNGDYYRFKLGAGVGYYRVGDMYIDATNVGGEEVTLNYDASIGAHVSAVFENNATENFSTSVGLRYYNVNYTYIRAGSTHEATAREFISPIGSGLDFLVGLFFHF
jgi:hypothetical protein